VIERVRVLIRQLEAEFPRATKQTLAKKVGVSPSMYSKLRNEGGPKEYLRSDLITEILEATDLSADFFFDPSLGASPDYRQHRRRPATVAAEPPHWADFSKQWPRFDELRPAEIAQLKSMIPAREIIRHWSDWIPLAEWLIAHRRKR